MSKVLRITEALIESKIYFIRGRKVMLDFDLAEMYAVETKRLKEQVKRNMERFPRDFMFEISEEEFSEHGVLMLSSVLRSNQAVQVNIQIMRVYSKVKELFIMHKDILVSWSSWNRRLISTTNKLN